MPDTSCESPIELLYLLDCPNHASFLPHLRQLLRDQGINDPVRLIEITGDDEAQRQRFLGSPTLRINGADVDPSAVGRTDYGMQCRIYLTEDGAQGIPPDSWVLRALGGGATPGRPHGPDSG